MALLKADLALPQSIGGIIVSYFMLGMGFAGPVEPES
jgi:hypothetical protein